MKNHKHSVSIPNISNYEIKYYFSYGSNKYDSRIFPRHVHDRLEFYILLDGDASFSVESEIYKLNAGDIIVTKPNEVHNCILNSHSTHRHACFWFDCSNEFLFGDFINHDFGKGNIIRPDSEHREKLNVLYEKVYDATNLGDKHALFYLTLEMLAIFRKFFNTCTPQKTLPEQLKNILRDIDLNFKTIKSLSYLTDKYFLSQSSLNRLFQTYIHSSPKQYIETKRFAYSRRLLKNGASVLSACMESGFSDYSNYIRLFKNKFGVTPKQYRDT